MRCPKCGTQLKENEAICQVCGTKVDVSNEIKVTPIKVEKVSTTVVSSGTTIKKKKTKYGTIIIFLLLLLSLFVNVILIVYKYKDVNTTVNKKSIYYDKYTFTVDEDWHYYIEEDTNLLIIYDKGKTFGVSVEFNDDISYTKFNEMKDKYTLALKEHDYDFTSEYEDNNNKTKHYLYKGKYNDYVTYVIVSDYDGGIIISKILFTGEVKTEIVNDVLTMISGIANREKLDFNEPGFNFKNIKDIVK